MTLLVSVYDHDLVLDESLGAATIPLGSLKSKKTMEEWYPLKEEGGGGFFSFGSSESEAKIKVKLEYKSDDPPATDEAGMDAQDGDEDTEQDAARKAMLSVPSQARPKGKLSTKKQQMTIRIKVMSARIAKGEPSSMDPVCRVSVSDQMQSTKTVEEDMSPNFDSSFYFEFFASPAELFDKLIKFSVYNSGTILADSLVGAFVMDIGTVYAQPNHQYYSQWCMLYLPHNVGAGAQGYLKFTAMVLGPNDKAVIPEHVRDTMDDEDLESDDAVLRPAQITAVPAVLTVNVYKAEDLPQMDTNWSSAFSFKALGFSARNEADSEEDSDAANSIDPYVKLLFNGHDIESKVVEGNYAPEFNQSFTLPIPMPSMCNYIKLRVFDKDMAVLLNPDDVVATGLISLSDISRPGEGGYLPTFGPAWINLYGSPRKFSAMPTFEGSLFERMDAGVMDGCDYRGRILVSVDVKPAEDPEAEISVEKKKIDEEDQKRLAKRMEENPQTRHKLRVQLLEATHLARAAADGTVQFKLSMGKKKSTSFECTTERDPPSERLDLLDPDKELIQNVSVVWDGNAPVLELHPHYEEDGVYAMWEYNERMSLLGRIEKEIQDILAESSDKSAETAELAEDQSETAGGAEGPKASSSKKKSKAAMKAQTRALTLSQLKEAANFALEEIEDQLELERTRADGVEKRRLTRLRINAHKRWIADLDSVADQIEASCLSNDPDDFKEIDEQLADFQAAILTLRGAIQPIVNGLVPDFFITMLVDKNMVGYVRLRPEDFVYSPDENQCGSLFGDALNLIMRSPEPPVPRSPHMPGQIQFRTWFGLNDQVKDWPRVPRVKSATKFDLRVHVHSARDLMAADDNGESDCYVNVHFGRQQTRTHVVKASVAPIWRETVVMESVKIYGEEDDVLDDPPMVILDLFDMDLGKDEFMGRATFLPSAFSVDDDEPEVKLKWVAVHADGKQWGEILVSAELFPAEERDDMSEDGRGLDEPVELDLARTHKSEDRDDNCKIALPAYMEPPTTPCQIDILALGLRKLKDFNMLAVSNPMVEFEVNGVIVATKPLDMRVAPNFSDYSLVMHVDLPEDDIYMPPLNISVFDMRLFGRKVRVAKHSVRSLAKYVDDRKKKPVPILDQTELRDSLRTAGAQESDDDDLDTDDESDSDMEVGGAIDEGDGWWKRFFSSLPPPESDDIQFVGDHVTVYQNSLEDNFNAFADYCETFELFRGSQSDGSWESCGLLKGHIRVLRLSKKEVKDHSLVPAAWTHVTPELLRPVEAVVRVYAIRGMDVRSVDIGGKSDPYLIVKLGDKEYHDEEHFVQETDSPMFGQMYEFRTTMPCRDPELVITMMDDDLIMDEFIGETRIDLENRYLSMMRGTCGLPRTYWPSTWRDVELPSAILLKWTKARELPEPEYAETSVSIKINGVHHSFNGVTHKRPPGAVVSSHRPGSKAKKAKPSPTQSPEVIKENAALQALLAVGVVPEHVETRDLINPLMAGASQGRLQLWVDILPRIGSIPAPVHVEPPAPKKYELRIIVWDAKDVVCMEESIMGEKMTDIFVRCFLKGMEDDAEDTDVHYRSLNGEGNFNWRMKFPLQYLTLQKKMVLEDDSIRAFLGGKAEQELVEPELVIQVYDYDALSANDYVGEVVLDLNAVPEIRKTRLFGREVHHKSLFKLKQRGAGRIKGWYNLYGSPDGVETEEEKKKRKEQEKEQKEKEAKMTPKEIRAARKRARRKPDKRKPVGRVKIEMELLEIAEAEAKPNENGNDEGPLNAFPTLPKPNRPANSFNVFSSPLKALYYIVFLNNRKKFLFLFMLIVLALAVWVAIKTVPRLAVEGIFGGVFGTGDSETSGGVAEEET